MNKGRLRSRIRAVLTGAAILLPALAVTAASPITASAGTTRMISASGGTSLQAIPTGSVAGLAPAMDILSAAASDTGAAAFTGNISMSAGHGGEGSGGDGEGSKATAPAALSGSFDGINHFRHRTANNGNQYSVEPPDQGLCAGNGFVVESVNDAIAVYDAAGKNLMPGGAVEDLNTFYGFPMAINRHVVPQVPGQFNVTDPSCTYDSTTNRWFQIVLTYQTAGKATDNHILGPNELDIAVSKTSSPLGGWTIYRLPVQDDGTQGTPNHQCTDPRPPPRGNGTGFGPCLGDYPHLGTDATGFYITTNEYSWFGPEFHGAQIYAFSKRALAAGGPVAVTQFDTTTADNGNAGFTLAPTTSPAGQWSRAAGGTEFFLSSNAADEADSSHGVNPGPGQSNQVILWSLSNTRSLRGDEPDLNLTHSYVTVPRYGIPPKSNQKVGDYPLGQAVGEPEAPLDSNDTRMLQATLAGGKVWAALDTALTIGGVNKAGIEWFVVNPSRGGEGEGGRARLANSGYLGVANNNLIYPAIGVTGDGHALMAYTLVGTNYFPSSAYSTLSLEGGPGPVQIAQLGAGPEDGFAPYPEISSNPRPRWGDYGATAIVGNTIWFASEYIGQTCNEATFLADTTCGGTRTVNANWDTRISHVNFDEGDNGN
jgi:hypothetical protein